MLITVNDEEITEEEISAARQQLEMQQQEQSGPATGDAWEDDPEKYAKDAVIARVLVKQEAQRRSAEVPKKALEEAIEEMKGQYGGEEEFQKQLESANLKEEDITRDIELSLRVDKLLDDVCKDLRDPSEEEMRQHYDEHPQWFVVPERIRAAHIVKHVRGNVVDMHESLQEMQDMLNTINNGTSFEELAAQHSDCPDNAGDLGYFERGAMVPEFEDVVFALKKGEVSKVFQTQFGIHIAKLYDRVPESSRDFDEVRDEVRDALHKERENAVIDAFTDGLREKAEIKET